MAAYLEPDVRPDVVDLERRVVEPEALMEHPLELEPDPVAVTGGLDEYMRRERRKAARHRPDMKVMGLDDTRMRGNRPSHVARRTRTRGRRAGGFGPIP